MDNLLSDIEQQATKSGMEAYIVGSKGFFDAKSEMWIPDGRLLKVCPVGVKTRVLLEIDNVSKFGKYKLFSHRTEELTREFRGRYVSVDWIIQFIKINEAVAKSISAKAKASAEFEEKEKSKKVVAKNLSDEEISEKKSQRLMVNCPCGGMNDRCNFCYGRGRYETNGLGTRL
jgi:hypothetical protein